VHLISLLYKLVKTKWKHDGLKVLIQTSYYYDTLSWEKTFIKALDEPVTAKMDVVYCAGKLSLRKHLVDAEICFLLSLSKKSLSLAKKVRMVFVPYQGVDLAEYSKCFPNIVFKKASPYSSSAIAEYCLATSIMLKRKLHHAIYLQSKKRWSQRLILEDQYEAFNSLVVGILGVGQVGKVVTAVYKSIGCKVIGCDSNSNSLSYIDELYHPNELDVFLSESNILVVCIPLTPNTEGMIGLKELKLLGKDSILVNVSRGKIVNCDELLFSLKEGVIGGAVLDVFDHEPLSRNSPYYRLPNVIITPHVSGNMNMFRDKIQMDFASVIGTYCRGTSSTYACGEHP